MLLLLLAGVIGGVAFLLTWDIPPPSQQVEKVIPNERFDQ